MRAWPLDFSYQGYYIVAVDFSPAVNFLSAVITFISVSPIDS